MCLKRLAAWGIVSTFCVAGLIAASGPDAKMADAAKAADKAAIRALIAKHADVNAPLVDGSTALHWAVYRDDLETVELLLRAGANVKTANRYGVTPLTLACTNGNAAIVKALLKAGADPNTVVTSGETVLMTAARTGNVESVNALISAGADIKAKENQKGQTALMWAAAEGHTEVVEALIKAGADIHARLSSGFTPLLLGVREGRMGVVRALLKAGADVNETIQPESVARKTGYVYARERVPRAGVSALHMAVANAHYELGGMLLDAGAEPNAIGPGYTALHTVTWIRKSGGGDNDPSPQGSGNMTSLDFVKKMVAKGADVNARMTKRVNVGLTSLNTNGGTAFFLAARTADADLMRALAAMGADPLLTNVDGSTPLMAAAGLGTRSPGEDAGTEPEVIEAMQAALDLGADINAVDKNGDTAMHGAAYKNLPGAVQFLVDKGAKIDVWNQKNKRGWTPLLIAEGYRFGNFKPSPETSAAIQKAMKAAGVSTVVVPPPDKISPTE